MTETLRRHHWVAYTIALTAAACSGLHSSISQRSLRHTQRVAASEVDTRWALPAEHEQCGRVGTVEVTGRVRDLAKGFEAEIAKKAGDEGANVVVILKDASGAGISQKEFLSIPYEPEAQLTVYGWAFSCANLISQQQASSGTNLTFGEPVPVKGFCAALGRCDWTLAPDFSKLRVIIAEAVQLEVGDSKAKRVRFSGEMRIPLLTITRGESVEIAVDWRFSGELPKDATAHVTLRYRGKNGLEVQRRSQESRTLGAGEIGLPLSDHLMVSADGGSGVLAVEMNVEIRAKRPGEGGRFVIDAVAIGPTAPHANRSPNMRLGPGARTGKGRR